MKRFCRQNDIHFRGSSSTDKKTLEIRGYSPSSESESMILVGQIASTLLGYCLVTLLRDKSISSCIV